MICHEGFSQNGYITKENNKTDESKGVIISVGVDLSRESSNSLKQIGLDDAII